MAKVSIIIPTLNEAGFLPALLSALREQTRPAGEIIVADAGSGDATVEIARLAGCRIVAGGRPARGRNAGALAAQGEILLFLDADVLPGADFLERTLEEFERKQLNAATCPVQPLSANLTDVVLHQTANVFIHATRAFNPHAPGFCIFCRKGTHAAIGGFDEALYMSEDHDYVRRAALHAGRFGILHTPIYVSVRRFDSDGRMNVAIRYSALALNQLFGDPLNQAFMDRYLGKYRFGHHPSKSPNG